MSDQSAAAEPSAADVARPRRARRRLVRPAIDGPLEVFPFFVGCPRSGTTLVRVMFDNHPELTIPRESRFIAELARHRSRYELPGGFDVGALLTDLEAHDKFRRWRMPRANVRAVLSEPPPASYAEAIRRLYALHAARKGKPRYGDKTPYYCMQMPLLAELFPEARFVHVIRDGRNTALSVIESPFGPSTLERAALFWRKRVMMARAAGRALGPERYLEYHHEELVADPRSVLTRICAFLDLDFDEHMLSYHERRKEPSERFKERFPHVRNLDKPPTTTRSWRDQLSAEDVRLFDELAGDALEAFGYERGASSVAGADPARVRSRARIARAREAVRENEWYQRARATRAGAALARLLKRSD